MEQTSQKCSRLATDLRVIPDRGGPDLANVWRMEGLNNRN